MARAKKQKLSLEQLLEQAVVKEEEWPYEVPSNWIWIKLGDVCNNVQYGYTAKSSFESIGPKFLRITDIQDNTVSWESVPHCSISEKEYDKFKINIGDIMIARTGATTGKSYLIKEEVEGVFASYLIRVALNSECDVRFLYHFMQSDIYWSQIMDLAQGIAQPGVNATKLQGMKFPLPPLVEQQRIVERIESLFEKLDAAKELVQDALESFEKGKAAILHKAFTGELTAKWREENSISLDSWELCEVGKLGEVKGGKRLPKGESLVNENTGFPYIKAGDLKNGTVLVDRLQYVKPEIQKVIKNYTVKKGDIYITIVGACIGDVGVIPEEVDGANLTENAAKITNLKCNNKYLAICLSSSKMQQQIKEKIASATLGKLSLTSIKSLIVPLPTFKEQCEIVDILENVLDKEVQAQELCDVIAKIDLMKKSILARAFRGELGTNNPEEESAIELLKEVLKEKL